MQRQIIPPKTSTETRTVAFDFTSQLATGETVTTAATTCSVYSGVDSLPASILGTTTVASPLVNQVVKAGVNGCTYLLVCSATTSAGNVLIVQAFLSVIDQTL